MGFYAVCEMTQYGCFKANTSFWLMKYNSLPTLAILGATINGLCLGSMMTSSTKK